jgi:large subunit ribosomal protein L23
MKTKILIKPLHTEKMAALQDAQNKYAFQVSLDSNKIEIKDEVEKRFDVKVIAVQTMRVRGKIRQQMTRAGRFYGRRPEWKKAIVTLESGQNLELFGNA